MPKEFLEASFEFVMKYPIQMLIGGGILLILVGQIIKTTGASTSLAALMDIGSQTALWGGGILVAGFVSFLVYLYLRYGNR